MLGCLVLYRRRHQILHRAHILRVWLVHSEVTENAAPEVYLLLLRAKDYPVQIRHQSLPINTFVFYTFQQNNHDDLYGGWVQKVKARTRSHWLCFLVELLNLQQKI